MLQDIQVGDTIMDGNDQSSSPSIPCGNCEFMTIVALSGSYPTRQAWLYRTYNPFDGSWNQFENSGGSAVGKLAHLNQWSPRMEPTMGHGWFTDFSNPVSWTVAADIGTDHPTYGAAAISPAIFGNYGTFGSNNIAQPVNTIAGMTGLTGVNQVGGNQNFNNTAAVPGLVESYLSQTAFNATGSVQRFVSNYRTPQANNGGAAQLYPVTATLVSGKSHTYLIGNPLGNTYDFKNAPWYGVAGRWLLKDVSATGTMSDALNAGVFCYAYLANGCFSGDVQGSLYINAPFIEPQSSLTCWGQAWNFSAPCVTQSYGIWGQSMIYDALDPDPAGANFMRLTGLFNPPFLSDGFEASKFSPDGKWLFYQGWTTGGYRGDVYAARVPNIAVDSLNRTTFVQIPMSPPAGSWLARFGYDANFHCQGQTDSNGNFISGYNDSCVTVASPTQSAPFNFSQEATLSPSTCAGGAVCFSIPAISGRILYYRLEKYTGATLILTGPTLRIAVP